MKKLVISAALALVLVAALAAPVLASSLSANEVASELVCRCGCNSVLTNCAHQECSSRDGMLLSIKQQIDAGKSKEEIIQGFVARYGEQVLAVPPKTGFNLTAWITPFAVLVGGALAVYLVLRLWVFRGKQPLPATSARSTSAQDEEYRRRVEKELEDFKETS